MKTETKQTVTELKAKAYDLIAELEMLQFRANQISDELKGINKQIENENLSLDKGR